MQDELLDNLFLEIKKSKNVQKTIKLHQKANQRLNELKESYIDFTNKLTGEVETPIEKSDMTEILDAISEIHNSLDSETVDLSMEIEKYIKLNSLVNQLELESTNIKNKLLRVEKNQNKYVLKRLNLDEII